MALTRLTRPKFSTFPLARYTPSMFGETGSGVTADDSYINSAIARAQAEGGVVELDTDIYVANTIQASGDVFIDCGPFYIKPLNALMAPNPLVSLGVDINNSCKGTTLLRVDCLGSDVTGVIFQHTSGAYSFTEVLNHNGHGIIHQSGYELYLHYRTVSVLDPLVGPLPDVDDSTNVGFISNTSDSHYVEGVSIGADVGTIINGGNNNIVQAHNWSTYRTDARKMRACFIDKGENNNFDNCMADSPCVIDYNQDASPSNGGYGMYIPSDGFAFGNKYSNFTTFIPTIDPLLGSVPVGRLIGISVNRSACEMPGLRTIDRTGTAILAEVSGSFAAKANYSSRSKIQIFNPSTSRSVIGGEAATSQWEFSRRLWATSGISFNIAYDATEDVSGGFGTCKLKMSPGSNWLSFLINDEGTPREIRVEKTQSGTFIQRGFLSLGPSDAGYKYYNTDGPRYELWNGTAWTNLDGTALT